MAYDTEYTMRLRWNKYIDRWIIENGLGQNLYELPDCATVNWMFPDLNKDKTNVYRVARAKRRSR